MTDPYLWTKVIHVVSSTILFGTGLGTAFHMWMAHATDDARIITAAARQVVWADFLFTTPAVVVQPISGVLLIYLSDLDPLAPWLIAAFALYLVAGTCWIPVVWLQIRARNLAATALATGTPLPPLYYRYMRLWLALGWPAFAAVLTIFWLMIAKPAP